MGLYGHETTQYETWLKTLIDTKTVEQDFLNKWIPTFYYKLFTVLVEAGSDLDQYNIFVFLFRGNVACHCQRTSVP